MSKLAFATPNRRAQFFARPHMDPFEMPDDDYPILLNTGRLAHPVAHDDQNRAGQKLNKLNPGPFVEIHPDDAAKYAIAEGDPVEVAFRRGRAVLPASVSDRVRPGNCFVPFHWNDAFGEHLAINAVTSDAIDSASQQPGVQGVRGDPDQGGPARRHIDTCRGCGEKCPSRRCGKKWSRRCSLCSPIARRHQRHRPTTRRRRSAAGSSPGSGPIHRRRPSPDAPLRRSLLG